MSCLELPELKPYLLCPDGESNSLYTSWCDRIEHVLVTEYGEDWTPPEDCGLVVTHLHYDYPTTTLLKRIVDGTDVAILILADGILEFRNSFLNPAVPAGSLFMPVLGHKIACIGDSQSRFIEALGNEGKTEVVGLPRLDSLRSIRNEKPAANVDSIDKKPKQKILIATARKAGFTSDQLEMVRRSLVDVRRWFEKQSSKGLHVEPVWRLTGGMDRQIGVENHESSEQSISDVMQGVDAVITTPSTTSLEAMVLDLPTALLDYTNSPHFVAPAWTITSSDHVEPVIKQMLERPASRMLFQRTSLADSLQLVEPAANRMIRLVKSMLEATEKARVESGALDLPRDMLNANPKSETTVDRLQAPSVADLFPCQLGFTVRDSESLVTELAQKSEAIQILHRRMDELRAEAIQSRQQARVAARHQEYLTDVTKWLRNQVQRLQLGLRISRRMYRKLRVRASISFLRWYFFVEQVAIQNRPSSNSIQLERVFELTNYPKGNRLPPTIKNFNPNRRAKPKIQMWKSRPSNGVLRRSKECAKSDRFRLRARRVMRAV